MEKFLGLAALFAILLFTSCDSDSIADEQILFENATGGEDEPYDDGREG